MWVCAVTANNKVYDGTTTATLNTGSATLMGVIGGDSVTLDASGATGTFASADVADGITVTVAGLSISGAQAGDYTLTQPTTTADIDQASTQTNVLAAFSGGTETFVATVVPLAPGAGVPTGTVTFMDGATVLASETLNGSSEAQYSMPSGEVNGNDVTVDYAGDVNFMPSSGTLTFNWSQTWAANPTITPPGDQTNVENDTVSLAISVSDPTGTALSYAAVGLPLGLSIDPSAGTITGTVEYLDAEVFSGVYAVTVVVANADGGSASTSFNWTVTAAPPVLTNPGDQTNYIEDDVDLQVEATDADDNWLTYSATGLPSGLAIDPDYGDISGVIDDSALSSSPYAVVVDVDDGMGNTVSESFNWTVGIMNPAPSLDNPGDQVNAVGDVVDVFPDSSDAAGYTLAFAAQGLPAGLSVDPGSGEITGTLTAAAASGSPYSVVLTASDGQLSDSQTFTWTVSAISLTNPGDQTDLVGDTVSLALTGTDGGVGSLTFGATGLPAGLSIEPRRA